VFKILPEAQRNTPRAIIYYMRTLSSLGETAKLRTLLSSRVVDDGEFYLEQAKLAYGQSKIQEAERLLDKGLGSPRQFMDSEKLRVEIQYYKALCATSMFDSSPGEATYKNALDMWWQVKNSLRSSPNHRYNLKAVGETQRIAEKYRQIMGK
jgi:hypothetical protein